MWELSYIAVVKLRTKGRLHGGNQFIANTIILDVSVKRIFKRIDFKRFVDQAFLVCDGSKSRLHLVGVREAFQNF